MAGDFCMGLTRQTIEAAAAVKKILLVLMDSPAVKQLKSVPGLTARYVFIVPPSREVAMARWSSGHVETGEVQIHEPMRQALREIRLPAVYNPAVDSAEMEYSCIPGVFDLILPTGNLDEACQSLVNFIQCSEHWIY
jgi:guanylate kinase